MKNNLEVLNDMSTNTEIEWENGELWGKFSDNNGNYYDGYMGCSSRDIYSMPIVDENGEIYAHRFCLDTNTFHEFEHISTYEGHHSLKI